MKALGCHVFAGGFTMGFSRVMPVVAQVERHDFGRQTVEQQLELPFINEENWEHWAHHRDVWDGCEVCFGNPRCTGFSCVTAGGDAGAHGPWAKCTEDIHELCRFGIAEGFPLIIWESVQQAFSTGRPLLDYLRDEYFAPAGYRIAHMFMNASSYGNAQQRRRYFFVAYRGHGSFNCEPPALPARQALVRDVLGPLEDREVGESPDNYQFGPDTHLRITGEDGLLVPLLRQRECKHSLFSLENPEARRLAPISAMKWDDRLSEMPFSMHCIRRMDWDWCCPTLFSACCRLIHPRLDRPITVREASRLMGWPEGVYPIGETPFAQICKGICPEVGEWLARQCELYLSDHWGDEDWETKWDKRRGEWVGGDAHGRIEKVLHLGDYTPPFPERDGVTEQETADV